MKHRFLAPDINKKTDVLHACLRNKIAFAYSLYIEYIAYVKVVAMTGNAGRDPGQSSRWGPNPDLVIVLKDGNKYEAELTNDKRKGERYEIELSVHNFEPSLICTHEDIKEVYLNARGNDGWYVESIAIYTAGTNKLYTKLTTDPGFTMWVDADEESRYPYNAKKHLLTNAVSGSCITYLRVDAMTGDMVGAGFSNKWGKNHLIVLILSNNQKLQAQLEGPMLRDTPYMTELHFSSRFQTTQCVSLSDIKETHLQTQLEEMMAGT